MNIINNRIYDTLGMSSVPLSDNKYIKFIYLDDQDSFKFSIHDNLKNQPIIIFVLNINEIVELISLISNIYTIDSDINYINKGYFYIKTEYTINNELLLTIVSNVGSKVNTLSLYSNEYDNLLYIFKLICKYYYFIKNHSDDINNFIIDKNNNINGFIYNDQVCSFKMKEEYDE